MVLAAPTQLLSRVTPLALRQRLAKGKEGERSRAWTLCLLTREPRAEKAVSPSGEHGQNLSMSAWSTPHPQD